MCRGFLVYFNTCVPTVNYRTLLQSQVLDRGKYNSSPHSRGLHMQHEHAAVHSDSKVNKHWMDTASSLHYKAENYEFHKCRKHYLILNVGFFLN